MTNFAKRIFRSKPETTTVRRRIHHDANANLITLEPRNTARNKTRRDLYNTRIWL
ncbi:MAG: hypothetical protein GKR98_13575 [Boseongicola sp.]|nr:MAG: hypothetical protein GKR98_13575 [Boseongicola sp.]